MSEFVARRTSLDTPLEPRLGALDIEMTERCDNDCIHCCINLPASDRTARAREMTTAQVTRVLEQAADLGCLQVRLTGGEPLLRPDFAEVYVHARRLGMRVLIFTNARRIDDAIADMLAEIPPLVPLEVTVYGMRRESCEAVTRAGGSFEQSRRGIDRLRKRRIPFIVKGVLLPPNRGDRPEFERWAATIAEMSRPPSYSLILEVRARRDDEAKSAAIAALRLAPEEAVSILTRDAAAYRRDKARFATQFMGPPGAALFRCGAGRAISVDAYGRAQPCMGLRAPEYTLDVLQSSLGAALDRFAELSTVEATDPEYLRRCAACFLAGLCEQCPARSWSENGTLDTPVEYLCEVAHAEARFLGWLAAGEYAWDVADWRRRLGA